MSLSKATASKVIPEPVPKKSGGIRAKIQKVGSYLSGMVMPNIGAFIAWGLVTAIFLDTGWYPSENVAQLISPTLTYLLPILIGFTGGRLVYDLRGGVIASVATMGIIIGSDIPMFLGAMIIGPFAGWCLKQVDKLFEGRIKPGFEMLVNNFSAGILGMILMLFSFFAVGPLVQGINGILSAGVNVIITNNLIPFTSVFIEPAKVLFLNNAINHGILSPIGITQAADTGTSILFLLEPNPGPGLGVLLAYTFFGKGIAKSTAPGVAIIHAIGGIHEPYFPYILMKPMMILASIAGGVSGAAIFQAFQVGLVATASPGSVFSILAVAQPSNYVGILLGIAVSTAVAFTIGSLILKTSPSTEDGALEAAVERKNSMKLPKSNTISGKGHHTIKNIIFACDAGMGSSAMGASILRSKLKKAGLDRIEVKNVAVNNIPSEADLIVTHESLTDRAKSKKPNALHISVENFMGTNKYDEIVEMLKEDK